MTDGTYHRYSDGPDRVEFTCEDCGERVERETTWVDIEGVVPSRCTTCTLAVMEL